LRESTETVRKKLKNASHPSFLIKRIIENRPRRRQLARRLAARAVVGEDGSNVAAGGDGAGLLCVGEDERGSSVAEHIGELARGGTRI
jgi:hypothetical protein